VRLSQTTAFYGARTNVTPEGNNVQNDVQLGNGLQQVSLPQCNIAYSVRAIIAEGSDFVINFATGDTTGTDAWVAGTAQVETATAQGTITASGDAQVVITGASIAGSPITLSVAVLSADTAATWAGKVRTAIQSNTAISAKYTVGGTSTAISLTAKPDETINGTPVFNSPSDATLNISLDNGTCTGITTATTSANTTTGVVTSGVLLTSESGNDWQNNSIPSNFQVMVEFITRAGKAVYTDGNDVEKGEIYANTSRQFTYLLTDTAGTAFGDNSSPSFTFTAEENTSDIDLIIYGFEL
jgi:hypothetical protein